MSQQKFVLAPDSFKGTLDADEICALWRETLLERFPEAEVVSLPIADGGEGMVDAFLRVCGGERRSARVAGPFGEPVDAAFGLLPDGTAVIETASCAGLPLAAGRLDPMRATTYGVGELLLLAAAAGCRTILLGLGGSCTVDGGVGMAAALGFRFYDAAEREVEPLAENLSRIARIRPPERRFSVPVCAACDVDNPLCGANGAAWIFGAQKGATPAQQAALDAGLCNLASVLEKDLRAPVLELPGAGAAGGLGAGVAAFLSGSLQPGIELLLAAAHFDEAISGANAVFTGEGRMDGQSLRGKAPLGVARAAAAQGIPCYALCGCRTADADAVLGCGITALYAATDGTRTMESIRRTCREDQRALMRRVLGERF